VTPAAVALLVLFALAAPADWLAVARSARRVELVAKPLATGLLVLLAVAVQPTEPAQRTWFVVALLLSLAGDVLLMLGDRWFVGGLLAFLLAHLAYVAGFVVGGLSGPWLLGGLAVVLVTVAAFGVRVLRAARDPAVAVYVVVISAMVVTAFGSGKPLAVAGALLFYLSDLLLGWRRFLGGAGWMPVAVMVTYHLGQVLLVGSLLT
jgi:uncharacterized membrane protein YhhN